MGEVCTPFHDTLQPINQDTGDKLPTEAIPHIPAQGFSPQGGESEEPVVPPQKEQLPKPTEEQYSLFISRYLTTIKTVLDKFIPPKAEALQKDDILKTESIDHVISLLLKRYGASNDDLIREALTCVMEYLPIHVKREDWDNPVSNNEDVYVSGELNMYLTAELSKFVSQVAQIPKKWAQEQRCGRISFHAHVMPFIEERVAAYMAKSMRHINTDTMDEEKAKVAINRIVKYVQAELQQVFGDQVVVQDNSTLEKKNSSQASILVHKIDIIKYAQQYYAPHFVRDSTPQTSLEDAYALREEVATITSVLIALLESLPSAYETQDLT